MRRIWGRDAIGLAALIAAAGCTVGPDFQPPAPPKQTGYTAPGEPGAQDAQSMGLRQAVALGGKVTADWWSLFHSAALDQLVRQAVAGNYTLESAKARLAASQETIKATASALYPQVDFSTGAARERVTGAQFGLAPGALPLPTAFNLFQVGPTASYMIDVFGGTHRQVERQTALADYQRYELDATYMSLTGNVVLQAVQVASLRAQRKATEDILQIDRQSVALVQTERQAGAVPDSDLVIVQSQLATDETLLPPLDQQLSTARHALAILLGQSPADWLAPDFDLSGLVLPASVPVSLPSDLVHQRPDILAAEAQLHAAGAQVGVAAAQLYPAITLSAAANLQSLDPGHLFNASSLVWSIAAGLTEPIFDGGLRQAQRRGALDAFRADAADYQQVVLQAFGQIADLLQALAHDADLMAAQKRALDKAAESVRLQQINYAAGGTGVLNLLEAQVQYQRALLGNVRVLAQRYQDTAQLLVAMGGGWWGAKLTVL